MQIIEYLEQVPTADELKLILKKIGLKAEQIVRKKEPVFKEHYEGKKISNAAWIKIICSNPILLERPIVIKGDKAIIARPPESIVDFINSTSDNKPQ